MLIKGATREEIHAALEEANTYFGGNLQFNRFDPAGSTRDGRQKHHVTLRVTSSKGPGHRLGFAYSDRKPRRLVSACWHAHGRFFDALPEGTEIQTSMGQSGTVTVLAGDQWNDYDVGSIMRPRLMSEMCECADDNHRFLTLKAQARMYAGLRGHVLGDW